MTRVYRSLYSVDIYTTHICMYITKYTKASLCSINTHKIDIDISFGCYIFGSMHVLYMLLFAMCVLSRTSALLFTILYTCMYESISFRLIVYICSHMRVYMFAKLMRVQSSITTAQWNSKLVG